MTILKGEPTRMTDAQAKAVQAGNSAADPEWTYKVEFHGHYSLVAVYDEDDELIGYL